MLKYHRTEISELDLIILEWLQFRKQNYGNKVNFNVSLMNYKFIGNKTIKIADYVIDQDGNMAKGYIAR